MFCQALNSTTKPTSKFIRFLLVDLFLDSCTVEKIRSKLRTLKRNCLNIILGKLRIEIKVILLINTIQSSKKPTLEQATSYLKKREKIT